MSTVKQDIICVAKARYAGGYVLELLFSDGAQRVVDVAAFLRSSNHPDIQKYLDKRKFKKFSVTHGTLHWNDFDLVFPMADLYEGKI